VKNIDLDATKDDLYWYRLITMIWAHVQFITVFALIAYVTGAAHLAAWEKVSFFGVGVGVITGTIGINYSHELMHPQKNLSATWRIFYYAWSCILISALSTCWFITVTSQHRVILLLRGWANIFIATFLVSCAIPLFRRLVQKQQ
jgi:hypothetical protein